MATLRRTDGADRDFLALVEELDRELWERYPAIQDRYDGLNRVPAGVWAVVACEGGTALGCGCLKPLAMQGTAEIKRVYVRPAARGRGIAAMILRELESWAREAGVERMILETGRLQPEAIGLYRKLGFAEIDRYGAYVDSENSVCMGKAVR